ncbi:uncharacterized protein LOC114354102 isoform X2 [Ostrinia furnacalis]|uniref:uncharacterized protein LOC114354102 isoform X2 n=1 Tax=Ostrinia furnacalis TaxID=93504 RepID=UPI00103B7EEE|nr:uncharacterized protein LOC114354102 isoform X2 [Ostrinia furnacalis]
MDRFRQKSKKESPMKHVDKDKSSLFIADVKSMKENIKIREILRTVKMNSSMRIKAPRGSKIMQNKDFNDNDDFDEAQNSEGASDREPHSAINQEMMKTVDDTVTDTLNVETSDQQNCGSEDDANNERKENPEDSPYTEQNVPQIETPSESAASDEVDVNSDHNSEKIKIVITSRSNDNLAVDPAVSPEIAASVPKGKLTQCRERKLSLDQTMLNRRESFSQSELDLHSIGKSPLERKSSFFRKKMDSFLKNTTEIFKRQSSHLSRRGSISVSLQSLNEKTNLDSENKTCDKMSSTTSLRSSSTVGRSDSSLSASQGERLGQTDSPAGTQPGLSVSQPLDRSTESINSLSESYIQDSLLNSRAISMSSGLDTAHGARVRKSRSNRVTWLASEGLTNYLRRVIQDEKNREIQGCHSYQDLSSIPENHYGVVTDSKGRRLSYQRAVSGEDPVLPTRYQDSSLRKKLIPENWEASFELAGQLAEFSRSGVPPLQGFHIANVPDEAFAYLLWAEHVENLENVYDWKKLSPNEEARQAVIRELVTTEADYIRHLIAIVEVFIAAAHALQDSGKLLDVDTEKLFSNIPDVLNASLYFWEYTIYPMLLESFENKTPFNTELMSAGFCRFRDLFQPYEKFVIEQTKALDYLRSLSTNADFMTYLTWCHGHKSCNRLQLSDIIIKPMQRLTKYSLILRRIITHTDTEPEHTNLIAMESFAKNYVLDLNRAIRQREELEKLDAVANSIDIYELDFKDEDLERYFRLYSAINLKAPMVNCMPTHSRTLIHQGDLRFRDSAKEIEVRAFLLTDMLLICKKLSKGAALPYKLIRPKYMVDRMMHFPKFQSRPTGREIMALLFVVVDDVGTAFQSFALTETAKDANPHLTLKLWEQKLREAKLTYELGVWFAKNPSRDISEVDMDSSSDYAASSVSGPRPSSDDANIEREARERVAVMLHRCMGVSTEYDFSQGSMNTDSFDASCAGAASGTSGRGSALHSLRHPMHRTSTGGSSRNSRLSSFHQSTSAASHDEPQAGPSSRNLYKAGTSVEHLIPPQNPDDAVTSITVNVVSESESETVVPSEQPPSLQQSPSPSKSAGKLASRSTSARAHNTLRVQPQSGVMALVHSLPDLTLDPSPPRPAQSPSTQSASDKLYQSHQELLHRNRLSAAQHHQYLSPNHRGTSYPPPSPTRASLKRGLAFSYSFKNPPLSKMGHVNSQSQQLQAEAGPSASKGDKTAAAAGPVVVPAGAGGQGGQAAGAAAGAAGAAAGPAGVAAGPVAGPSTAPVAGPSTSSDKGEKEKKSKFISSSSFFSSGGWHSKLEG